MRGFFRIFMMTILISAIGSLPAKAEELPTITTVLRQMKSAFEPSGASTRRVELILSNSKGKNVRWIAGQARKALPDGKYLLLVILEPKRLGGTACLIWEHKDKKSTFSVYQPALQRVRELSEVEIYDRFAGTDHTYADLGFIPIHERYQLVGIENHGEIPAYTLEEKDPGERSYYSRVITWVSIDSSLPIEREY